MTRPALAPVAPPARPSARLAALETRRRYHAELSDRLLSAYERAEARLRALDLEIEREELANGQ
jgi:hypothetical protein